MERIYEAPLYDGFLLFTYRCYADATLEHSQVVKEDAKARALSAATSELEKLFKKEDFGRMKVVYRTCLLSVNI